MSVGDRVQYSSNFLKCFGIHSGDIPFMVGTVVKIKSGNHWNSNRAVVRWDGETNTQSINKNNLVLANRKHLEER